MNTRRRGVECLLEIGYVLGVKGVERRLPRRCSAGLMCVPYCHSCSNSHNGNQDDERFFHLSLNLSQSKMTRQQSRHLLREKEHGKENDYRYPEYCDVHEAPPSAGFSSAIELQKPNGEQNGGNNQQPRPQSCEHRTCACRAESGNKCEREAAGKRTKGTQDRQYRRYVCLPLILLSVRFVHLGSRVAY